MSPDYTAGHRIAVSRTRFGWRAETTIGTHTLEATRSTEPAARTALAALIEDQELQCNRTHARTLRGNT